MLRLRLAFVATIVAAGFVHPGFNLLLQSAEAKVESKGKNTVSPSVENFQTALAKYKAQDIDGAIDAFLQAIYFSRNYYNPDAYYWLGVCYMEKKQDAKAIEALNKHCQQAVGDAAEGHLHLAEIYLRNDRLDEAEQEAHSALTQYRGIGSRARNVLGLISEKRGLLEQGQFQFELALGDPPWRYTEAWMNLGENMMKQKNWAGALTEFNAMLNSRVLLKGLDYEKVLLDMGLCLLAKGDHQGAIDHWHECLNYNQGNAAAHLQLAMIFDLEQHFVSAIKEYREFVRYSQDQAAIGRVKNRIGILEQKIGPSELEPQAPQPSAYTRKQEEEEEKQQIKQKENLAPSANTKDSGF
jgi:tetratricopeptide (TPR) repeat protein